MRKIVDELEAAISDVGLLLVPSVAGAQDSQALDLLLEKFKAVTELAEQYGLESWNQAAVQLLEALNRVKTGNIAYSKQLAELLQDALELLLEDVERPETNGRLEANEEACQNIVRKLKLLLASGEPVNVLPMPEECSALLAKYLDAGKCLYEVSLELSSSAETPDLLAIFKKLLACGEIIHATVSGTGAAVATTNIPSFLSLQFYLWSDFSAHILEKTLREVAGDTSDLRLSVCPVFLKNGKLGEEKKDVTPEISEKGRKMPKTGEELLLPSAFQLKQKEGEVLKLILAQQREYLGLPCSPEDFLRRASSAAKILGGMGAYLGRPELSKKSEELVVNPVPEPLWREELFSLLDVAETAVKGWVAEEGEKKNSSTRKEGGPLISAERGKTIRVDEGKVDRLMALAGELLVKCNALPYVTRKIEADYGLIEVGRELQEHYVGLNRLVQELQDAVMGIRLLPASYVFQKFPRMVRDLAKELDKKVELRLEGEDTEIDKAVMEAIGEPMVHLVRNAIDHGLEPPEERLSLGKAAEGTIILRALREGSTVVLEIEDDGRGIDVERVLQNAIAAGLVSAEEAEYLDQDQVLEFLFVSGFSTAEKVTKVSGRGVGMDAVKATVRSLNGTVKIRTSLGVGTVVRLELPLTLVTSQVLVVVQNGRKYGLPLADVREMIKVNYSELTSMRNRPVAVLRGELAPVVFLSEFLGTGQKETDGEELCLVVMNDGFALGVDGFLGQEDIVLKPLGKDFGAHSCFAGAAILGNGDILLVLDPKRIRFEL